MMFKISMTILVSIITTLIIFSWIWHYLLSIYEIKFIYDFNPSEIRINQNYYVKATAKNSYGWDLNFRNTDLTLNVIKGGSLINIKNDSISNCVSFRVIKGGEIELELNSKYSLNQTRLKINCRDLEIE